MSPAGKPRCRISLPRLLLLPLIIRAAMCQFSPALLGTVSRTFKLCLDLARFVELLDPAMLPLPPVGQSASAAVNKPQLPSRWSCPATRLRWVLFQRPYLWPSFFVIVTHPTRSRVLVWRDSLVAPSWTELALQIGLLLTSRFHGNCQVARFRLAPSSKLVANSVSLQPFDFRSGKNCMTLLAGFAPLVMLVRHLLPLGVVVSLLDLFFVAIVSVASHSWLCLCGDHHSPSSQDRWLSSPSVPCSALVPCGSAMLFSFQRFSGPSPGCFSLCVAEHS